MIIHALIAFLVLMLVVACPVWPYSRQWGYVPAGGIALIVLLLVLLIHFDVV